MTKRVKLILATGFFAAVTGIPVSVGDMVGAITGVIIVAILAFWAWDTLD